MTVARLRSIKGTPEHRHRVDMIKAWTKRNPEKRAEYVARYKTKYRLKRLIWSAIKRCRKNGMPYDEPFMLELIQEKPTHCSCCGNNLDYSVDTIVRHAPKNRSPSLDRVNTMKGYLRGNVQIICWRCNALKRDGTLDEIEAIASYMRARL